MLKVIKEDLKKLKIFSHRARKYWEANIGEVRTRVILENYGDRYSFTKGYIKESEIRRREVDAFVVLVQQ